MIDLSIILPIYNVEPFLEKCIRSLENQDIPKDSYEIICVNDGSPDNCLHIIKKLQKEFDNIVLIDQENQGVSMARNNGIKKAKGNYLLFVDPDDSIEKSILLDLLNFASTQQLDVVYSPYSFVELDGTKKEIYYKKRIGTIIDGVELYFSVRGKEIADPDRSVAILYKRDFIISNKLFYLKNVPYLEDGEFIARVLCLAKRTAIYNQPYYLRLNRPGSATRSDLSTQKRSIIGFILAANNLREFKNNNILSYKQTSLINGRIVKFVVLAVHATLKSPNNFVWTKNKLKKNNLIKLNLEGVDKNYLRLGQAFNQSINLFYLKSILKNMKKSIRSRISLTKK